MLAQGALIGAVVVSFCGRCSRGRAGQAEWLAALAEIPSLEVRRRVLEHFLRTFNFAALHGSQWRVIGADGFVGKQHQPVPKEPVERLDALSGEVTFERPHGYPGDVDRRHYPGESAGPLAAESGRSPRTLNRYRKLLRDQKIMASQQPPYDAPDAVRPRAPNGRWAYAQHWLRIPPTPEMVSRWRARPRVQQPTRPRAERPFSAARAPRLDDLRELAAWAEREA